MKIYYAKYVCFLLSGRIKYLTLTDPKKVWMPDTFFRNEKTGHFHNILVNNVYIRIFPNGDVLYSIRISLTLSCPMHLKLYPMDRQTCALKIASCRTLFRPYIDPDLELDILLQTATPRMTSPTSGTTRTRSSWPRASTFPGESLNDLISWPCIKCSQV